MAPTNENIRAIVLTALDFTELIFELVASSFSVADGASVGNLSPPVLVAFVSGGYLPRCGSLRCGGSLRGGGSQPTGVSQMPSTLVVFLAVSAKAARFFSTISNVKTDG